MSNILIINNEVQSNFCIIEFSHSNSLLFITFSSNVYNKNAMEGLSVIRKSKFGDYKIKWGNELTNPEVVIDCINQNLPEWIQSDSPSVWIKLRGNDLKHLHYFLTNGFKMHRILNGETLVLNRWIRAYSNTLPPGPFSYIGVGACCIKDGMILVERENFKTGPGPWKLPGGSFDTTKDRKISDTAIRECFEETGIKAKFEFIPFQRFAFRSPSLFHQPDAYYIARLTPLTTAIKMDNVEIADCKWMDIDEFLSHANENVRKMVEPAIKATTGYREIVVSQEQTYYVLDEE